MTINDRPRRAADGKLREREDSGALKGDDAVDDETNLEEVVACERDLVR
jgi:hypothetical protein